MNTLWAFGCSFTAPYSTNRLQYRQYYNYKQNSFPIIWADILADKLGFGINNYGTSGCSNYEIFGEFCKNVNNFQSGDIVIIGWTFKERFRLVDMDTNEFTKIFPNTNQKLKDISNSTINELYVNRNHHCWVEEVLLWNTLISKVTDGIGVKFINWSFDDTFPNDIFILNDLIEMGATTILEETNGLINDKHFGEIGHLIQANYLYNKLINNKQNIL